MGSGIRLVVAVGMFLTFLCSCQNQEQYRGFTTQNGKLIDANGNAFIMKGINLPNAWFKEKSYQALDAIADKKVNCVRIVWESHLSAKALDSVFHKCIDLHMIPMIELHDATGDTTATKLYQLANYFVSKDMKAIIRKYEPYLLINIANEWGDHSVKGDYWRDAYKKCISLLRSEGIESVIVIDAPGWGQNIDPMLQYGQELIRHDSLHNLLFSVHMYGSWNDEEKIKNDLKKAHDLSLPLIVGEFGYNYSKGDNNLGCKVNHEQILKTCNDLDMGYLAWSWTGNNQENAWLDLVEYNDWTTLTTWGKGIFDSPYGIQKTAQKASVFN